jgi:hypothetical protein
MATQRQPNLPPDKIALYDKLIATNSKIERSHMFSLLHSGVLALRLPRREREEFLKNYNATLYEACGTVMKRLDS